MECSKVNLKSTVQGCEGVLYLVEVPAKFMVCCLCVFKNESEEKSRIIEKLTEEVQVLKALKQQHKGKRHKKQPSPVPPSTSQQQSPSTSPPPSSQHHPLPTPTDTTEPTPEPHDLSTSDLVLGQVLAGSVEEGRMAGDKELHGQTQQEHSSERDERPYEPSDDPSLESTKL